MAVFKRGEPIATEEPVVRVDRLLVGDHVFQLVVVDDEGNESAPDVAEVRVIEGS
jgi:hypothetical protein